MTPRDFAEHVVTILTARVRKRYRILLQTRGGHCFSGCVITMSIDALADTP